MVALVSGDRDAVDTAIGDGQLPLLAVLDNGPQIRSHATREFLAGVAIAQQFGRPGIPQEQGWIETLSGHVKGEWPELGKTCDPGELATGLERVRLKNKAVRLHAAVGYFIPIEKENQYYRQVDPQRQRR